MLPIPTLKPFESLERLWGKIVRSKLIDKNTKKILILLVTMAILFEGLIITQTLLILLVLFGRR